MTAKPAAVRPVVRHSWPLAAAFTKRMVPLLRRYTTETDYTEARLSDDVRRLGSELLGLGRSRAVIALPSEHVLKIHYRDHTMGWMMGYDNANPIEAWAWESADARDAMRLAPVMAVARDGSWLVMERTTPLTAAQFRSRRRSIAMLPTADENVRPNVGWLRGRIVLHDYAI